MERLLNIKTVEYIEARYLSDIKVVKNRGVLLGKWRDFQKIQTVGLSSLTSETKVSERETIYTLKLNAELPVDFNVAGRRLCYRLTTVTGGQFLLGTNEAPFPVTTVAVNYPSVVTDKSSTKLTAEYSNIFGLLAILD